MRRIQEHVVSIEEAAALVRTAQKRGETVVMCHGCFDIVHPGHVRHLQHAAKLGDRLLVSVSSDAVVAKGTGRPLIPQELRAENLAALDCVCWVTVSGDATAVEALTAIQPDVYVKGREYEQNRDPRFEEEKRVVQAYGGRVVFTSGEVVFSSTALINGLEDEASPAHAALMRLLAAHRDELDGADALISRFQGRRVIVAGETIIDTYVMCDRPDVAGEGPIMTLRPLEYRSFDGGAAIIARHLAALGARPVLVTALPRSTEAQSLRLRLEVEGVEVVPLAVEQPLFVKQRYLVGTSKVMKLDLGTPLVLDADHQERLIGAAFDAAASCDAMVIADFGLGLWTAPMLQSLTRRVRSRVPLIVGDVSGRRSNLLAMRGVDLLCPSEPELRAALHDYEQGMTAVVWNLLDRTQARSAIITLGDEGLISFSRRDESLDAQPWSSQLQAEHVPSLTVRPIDPLGCGDALLAAATLALSAGASLPLASILGSISAAAQVQKLGNAVIGAAELRRGLQRLRDTRLTFDAPAAAISRLA